MEDSQARWLISQLPYEGQVREGVEKHDLFHARLTNQHRMFLQTTLRPQISRALPQEGNKVFCVFNIERLRCRELARLVQNGSIAPG